MNLNWSLLALKKTCQIYFLVVALVITAGCGSAPDTGTVTGVVTLDGAPVGAGVAVIFGNQATNILAHGSTNGEGRFDLVTSRSKSTTRQLPTGSYSVTCIQENPVDVGGISGVSPDELSKVSIPIRYSKAATSGLTLEVKQGDNDLEVKLVSSKK